MKNEVLRKLAHVSLALVLAFGAPWLGLPGVLAVGALLFVVFVVTRKTGRFGALRRVERVSYGELYFAFGIIVTAGLFLPHHIHSFQAGMLVLGIADTLAALIGKRWGRHRYRIWGDTLSYEGSFVCFIASTAILYGFGVVPVAAAFGGLVLAGVEACARRGLDNLLLPVLAGVLVYAL